MDIDIYPTAAGFCGVPTYPEVQGLDQSAAICGKPGPQRAEALVQWMGASLYGWGDHPYRAIRNERYTYCVSSRQVDDENNGAFRLLFDNREDQWQLSNLFGRPEARELQSELHEKLCRAIVASGEEIPDFVADVGAELVG